MMDGEDDLPLTEVFFLQRARNLRAYLLLLALPLLPVLLRRAPRAPRVLRTVTLKLPDLLTDTMEARLSSPYWPWGPRLLSTPMLLALENLSDLRLLCSPWQLRWTTFATKWRTCVVVWTLPTTARTLALQGHLLLRTPASLMWNTSSGLWRRRSVTCRHTGTATSLLWTAAMGCGRSG